MIATKRCSKCKSVKPIEQFHSDKTNRDGKRVDCIGCVSIRRKRYYADHREEQKQYSREFRRTHPEAQEAVNRYQRTPPGRFAKLKVEARSKGASLELTLEQYTEITASGKCFYCGGAISVLGHGLDRKDPRLGYSTQNCVPCCSSCNRIKFDILTSEEMLAVAKLLREMRTK